MVIRDEIVLLIRIYVNDIMSSVYVQVLKNEWHFAIQSYLVIWQNAIIHYDSIAIPYRVFSCVRDGNPTGGMQYLPAEWNTLCYFICPQ